MKTKIAFILGILIALSIGRTVTAQNPFYFTSLQLAPSPSNGKCLTTNGSKNVWSTCASGGGGGSVSIGGTPTSGQITYWQDGSTIAGTATGTLSENVTGLELSASRSLIGGAAAINLTSGYVIPLSASTTNWQSFYTTPSGRITAGNHIDWTANTLDVVTTGNWTGTLDTYNGSDLLARANHTGTQLAATISDFVSTVRTSISETITGITYDSGTGVFSLDAGRTIPLTASTTNWNSFYNSPSTRITDGTGLTWSTNTLNCDTASGSVQGCLTAADWTSFNGRVASTSIDTSTELRNLVTDETGTGALVFATSPVLTTPNLGTPSALTLTNATGLPIGGLTGLGTGVSAALAINVGTAGSFITNGGALGTPSSGTLTNATGLPIVGGTTGTLTETRGGTNQTTYATGDMLYASGANTLAKRSIGSTGNVLSVVGGVPTWVATSSLGISGGGGGGVTSVAMTVPTGLTVSGSPITTSGTLAVSLAGGYNIPLTASTTNWNTFYNTPSNRITANDGLTWSGNNLNFDGGNAPLGELGGTWASPTIDDSIAVTGWNLTTPTLTTSGTFMGDTISDFTGFGMSLSSGALGLNTTGALNGECLTYNSTGPTIDWVSCGGGGGGSGDVVGPASATDNALARFDTTTGKLLQNSTIELTDTGVIQPVTDDGGTLGSITNRFSDFFLAVGGVINWDNGDVILTHSANLLSFTGASLGYSFDSFVDLLAISEPSAPSSTNLRTYARSIAGKFHLFTKNILGESMPPADALWYSRQYQWTNTGSSAGLWRGTVGASAGTFANTLPTNSTIYTQQKRGLHSNIATTLNQTLGQRNTEAIWWRGDSAGEGGFFSCADFGFTTWTNGSRLFFGLHSAVIVIQNDPSTLANTVGFAVDAADNGAINFLTRDATTATKASTGLTITSGKGYKACFYAAPNDTKIGWWIKDVNTGTIASGSATTNLPSNTTFLTVGVLASNGTNAAVNAVQLGISQIFIQSDY